MFDSLRKRFNWEADQGCPVQLSYLQKKRFTKDD